MNKELLNIIKISFANGDKELQNAKANLNNIMMVKLEQLQGELPVFTLMAL